MAARDGQLQELQCGAEHDGRNTNNSHPQFVPQTEANSVTRKTSACSMLCGAPVTTRMDAGTTVITTIAMIRDLATTRTNIVLVNDAPPKVQTGCHVHFVPPLSWRFAAHHCVCLRSLVSTTPSPSES